MKVCLPGLINNAVRQLENTGDKGTAYLLKCLGEHLEELRDDHSRIQEFFDLYAPSNAPKDKFKSKPTEQ